MNDQGETVSAIARLLPHSIRQRFNSLGPYVRGLLEAEGYATLSRDHVETIHLAVFAYTLKEFLQAGTRAAKTAAEKFEEHGFPGFSVGNTIFTKDNGPTLRGDEIAALLARSLEGTTIGERVESAQSMKALVRGLAKEFSRG
ncbi:MAG: hypothetical protein V4850_01345 [Myxococcota bacterium]